MESVESTVMLQSLRLTNVRSFEDSKDIPLAPLTIIVGPNNAGKSTILDSLLLLRQSLEDSTFTRPLVTAGAQIDMGSFEDIVRGGAHATARNFAISLSIPKVIADSWPVMFTPDKRPVPPAATALSTIFCLDDTTNDIRLTSARFERESEVLLEVGWSTEVKTLVVRSPESAVHLAASPYNFIPNIQLPESLPSDADEAFTLLSTISASEFRTQHWHRLIVGINHLSPIRTAIPRVTLTGRTTAAGGELEGENLVQLLAGAGSLPRGAQKNLVEVVNYWMAHRFRMIGALRSDNLDEAGRALALVADDRKGFKDINVANMGAGISQLLPVVAGVILAQNGSSLLVEQPEIHLHPAAQADLGDLFVESVTDLTGPQFIVETHSEHLLMRVRRRIAEGRIAPDVVSVLYVDKPGNASKVQPLELDERGHFPEWPSGFFEEGYSEALNLARANAK